MTKLSYTVTSDRKKRRRLNSVQRIEAYLKRKLVEKTKQPALAALKTKAAGRLKRGSYVKITSKSNTVQGTLTFNLHLPGFRETSSEEFNKEFQSWLGGQDVAVRETSTGWLYFLGVFSKKKEEVEAARQERYEGRTKEMARKFGKMVMFVVRSDRPYMKKRQEAVNEVLKDLSLADVRG